MTYFERYINGDENNVWREIYTKIHDEFEPSVLQDISNVLDETIKRVKYNILKIYDFFGENIVVKGTLEKEINELKKHTNSFGKLPLSIEKLYLEIQYVDFTVLNNECMANFQLTDPLFIDSVKNIISIISDGSWEETMGEEDIPYFYFSPDCFHKDHIGGGMPYGIELTPNVQFDSRVINSKYGEIYFLDYLRLCFENFGFPNIADKNSNFELCFKELKGELKKI